MDTHWQAVRHDGRAGHRKACGERLAPPLGQARGDWGIVPGKNHPSLDGLQGQSRQVQKIYQLLIKKITILITAQHFLVDQSTSKKMCFCFFFYDEVHSPSLTCPRVVYLRWCRVCVCALPSTTVRLRLRGRMLMHLWREWRGTDKSTHARSGVCSLLPRQRQRTQRSWIRERTNTPVFFLCESVTVLPLLSLCARLCAHKHNCLYIVLQQMCVCERETVYSSFTPFL